MSETPRDLKIFYYAGRGDYDSILREVSHSGPTLLSAKDSSTKQTILHFAAEANALEFLYFVLGRYGKHVDMNSKDAMGWTPLLCGAKAGALAVCNILIQKGCDVSVRTNDGSTVLHYLVRKAVPSQDEELACQVFAAVEEKGETLKASANESGETPMHLAAMAGNLFFLKQLVEHGVDMNAKTKSGQTVLHLAVCSGRADVVTYVLESGADKSVAAADGQTAADLARRLGMGETAALIDGFKSLDQMTPTEIAWRYITLKRYNDAARQLRDPAVDVTSVHQVGMERVSMLLYFASHGLVDLLQVCMQHPTFVQYDKAAVAGTLKALITRLDLVTGDGLLRYLSIIEKMIDVARVNPNIPFDASKDNLLFVAVRAHNHYVVALLLSVARWGVEVDRKHPQSGDTALVLAVKLDAARIVQLLLEAGANLELSVSNVPLAEYASGECQELLRTYQAELVRMIPLVAASKDSMELNLSALKLTRVPQFVFRLRYLRVLNLASNRLHVLDAQIGELRNLRTLILDDNNLAKLPVEIAKLSHLNELSVKLNPCMNVHIRRLSEISCYRVKQYLLLCEEGVVSQEDVSPSNSDDEDDSQAMFHGMQVEDENMSQVSVLKNMLFTLQKRELKLRDYNIELQAERAALDAHWEKLMAEKGSLAGQNSARYALEYDAPDASPPSSNSVLSPSDSRRKKN